ncbi:odorant receptor 85b-like [Microplitis demolitor]|uniref:odorant receptor 85b-like n=1 Tax=Microplitis demolitor TaxID=69319 RepID=UPI0006D528C7|nr:odorant receptor 85b-like [Microplitis demolitor]
MENDQKELDEGVKAFYWAKRMSRCIGLWPVAPNYYLFNICILYFSVLMVLELIDLYNSVYDIDKLIDNFTENLASTHMYARILMLRVHNYRIGKMIMQAMKDYRISAFKNSYEINVFMEFVNKGKFLIKGLFIFIMSTEISWFLKPLTTPSSSDNSIINENKTLPQFILPYNVYIFYEVNSLKRYILTYLSFMPMVYVSGIGHSAVDCILVLLVFYISGKLSVLTMRIDALKNNQYDCRKELREIIAEHSRLLKMGDEVKDVYSTGLLVYLVNGNLLICIIGYQILINYMTGPNSDLLQYFVYIGATYFMISNFCIISEHLTAESNKVCEAYWNCEWYNMPQDCVKDIIYCILRSQRPLALQAGKFSTFSIVTLTDVTKTALSYLSVLRNFLIAE